MQKTVMVGGLECEVLPLSPLEWLREFKELPEFIYGLIKTNLSNDVTDADFAAFIERVRGWLRVSARFEGQSLTESHLERLSVPEAASAATVVSAVNGFDANLREFFLGFTQPRDPSPDG